MDIFTLEWKVFKVFKSMNMQYIDRQSGREDDGYVGEGLLMILSVLLDMEIQLKSF